MSDPRKTIVDGDTYRELQRQHATGSTHADRARSFFAYTRANNIEVRKTVTTGRSKAPVRAAEGVKQND